MSTLYGDSIFTINEADLDYKSTIKKYESKIKKFINNYSEVFFKQEKNNKENIEGGWREVIIKAPKVWKFDYNSSNIVEISLDYKGSNADHDEMLFYEDDFVKFLNKQKDTITDIFRFSTEDYPGILIYLRKSAISESVLTCNNEPKISINI